MSLKKVLLTGAALAIICSGSSVWAQEDMPADHGAPEGHAHSGEMPSVPVADVAQEAMAHNTHAEWNYGGENGPAHWGALDEAYKLCAEGTMQSPINIAEFMQEDLPKLKIAYAPSPLMVVNNGHTIQVNYEPGSKFMSADKIYDLKQIHFHTPSEHYMDGAPYPMEMHLVHTTSEGDLAVIGVMMKVGMHNHALQKIWDHIPAGNAQVAPEGVNIKAAELLPQNGTYYTYSGSLTTPPCSEGVKWHVLQQPVEISRDQLVAFQAIYSMNARPIQQMQGRVVKGS
ncbi:MAG: carbonic anhydrase [Alphaproteobacteria bacterium]